MNKLQAPIGRHLAERVDENAVQRIWSGVRARRQGSLFVRRRGVPVWGWALLASLALLLLGIGGFRYAHAPSPRVEANGPLTLRAGAALSLLGGARASSDDLSDGSTIRLDAGSQLEVLENTSKTFVSALRRGRGSFSVQPGGPRRWTIEAGLLTVEVVGTRFSVTRRETAVVVAVEHGVVLVRSELITDHVQRLTAGQELSVQLPSSLPLPGPSAVAPAERSDSTEKAPELGPNAGPPGVAASLPAVASTPGVGESSVEELLTGANELRKRGDVRGAEASLRRALNEHPSGPQTALVAFTLGKLLLDSAGRPADAALAFQRCLAAAPPSALAEDALFRLAQAQSRAGDAPGASASARRYQGLYPSGRHAADVNQWLLER